MAPQWSTPPETARLARVVARQRGELARLRAHVDRCVILERATGALVERLGCSPSEAVDHLTRLAERAGMSVLDIAAEVGGGPAPQADADAGPIRPLRLRMAEAAVGLAADGVALAEALFTTALATTGAVAVAFWLLQPDGVLLLAGQYGLDPLDAARWRSLPPDMATASRAVLAERAPHWLPEGAAPGTAVAAARWPGGARAVLPLTHHRTSLGVLEICWPTGLPDFPAGLRTQLTALADLCAATLAPARPDRSAEPEVAARPPWLTGLLHALADGVLLMHADRAEDGTVLDLVVDHVSDAAAVALGRPGANLRGTSLLTLHPLTGGVGGLFERLRDVLTSGVPYRADALVVPTLVGGRVAGPVVDIRAAPLSDGVAVTIRRHDDADLASTALRLSGTGGWEDNLLTGRSTWTAETFDLLDTPSPVALPDMVGLGASDTAALDRFHNALLAGRGASAEFTLRTASGEQRRLRAVARPVTDTAGSVLALRGAVRDMGERDHAEFALLAAHDQLADAERKADRQQRLAVRLQQAIIASAPPPNTLSGLQVVVRYRAAGNQYRVGGDWYDALALPSGQVMLAVGDMVGHGIDVVTGMITMRNALRGLAVTGASPGRLLHWLNQMAYSLPEPTMGTAVCACWDPTTGTLRWARAGHPPPMLVRDGEATFLPLPSGAMFGVLPDAEYADTSTELRPGDVLALFTDGLVERRGETLDHGMDRLLASAHDVDDDLDHYGSRLLDHIQPNKSDDTCLVVVRVTSQPHQRNSYQAR